MRASYTYTSSINIALAAPVGLEPTTTGSEGPRSSLLSYGAIYFNNIILTRESFIVLGI